MNRIKEAKFKIVHLFILASSTASALYLIWLNYLAHASDSRMVMCWGTDITNAFGSQFYAISHTRTFVLHGLVVVIYVLIWAILKAKDKQRPQNFSQNVFKSLLVIVGLELFGWFPALFIGDLIKMVGMDPVQANYLTTSYGTMSLLSISANASIFYYFSQSYRKAMNAILASIGLISRVVPLQMNQRPRVQPMNNGWVSGASSRPIDETLQQQEQSEQNA